MPQRLFGEGDRVKILARDSRPEGRVSEVEYNRSMWRYRVSTRVGEGGEWFNAEDLMLLTKAPQERQHRQR